MFCVCQLMAQVGVSGELAKTEIMIGDQVEYRLHIEQTSNVQIENIDLSPLDTVSGLEVLNVAPPDTISTEPMVRTQQRVILTSFDSGYYYLPQLVVSFVQNGVKSTAKTNEILLTVNTLPVSTDSIRLEPIKDIIEEPLKFQDAIPYLIGLILLVGLVGLIWYYYKRRKYEPVKAQPERRLPAHEIALQKLEDLKNAKLWQQGQVKEFQSELTFILREYLENRYQMRALESTTDEIVQDLKRSNVDPDWHERLKTMLETADLVKFAKAEPPVEIHAKAWDEVEAFVLATKKVALPAEEDSEEEVEENA